MQHLLIATTLWLAGCASSAARGPAGTTPDPAASTSSDDGLICTDEVRTGSNLPRRVCRSQVEIDSDKRSAQDALQTPSSRPHFEGPTP